MNSTSIFACLLSFLMGSIPFGLLLTKVKGLGDIRDIGSGNIGATNVLRTGKKALALITLLADGIKGLLACYFVGMFAPEWVAVAGLAAVLGHMYTPWLKFKGGKGVATTYGVWLYLLPLPTLLLIVCWFAIFFAKRYASLASILTMLAGPIIAVALHRQDLAIWMLLMALLVIWRHRANIERLIAGTEHQFKADPS